MESEKSRAAVTTGYPMNIEDRDSLGLRSGQFSMIGRRSAEFRTQNSAPCQISLEFNGWLLRLQRS